VTNVWTLDLTNGNALFCVTNFATEYSVDMATWSKSGSTLIFASTLDPANPSGGGAAISGYNLFAVGSDGNGLRALTVGTNISAVSVGPYWAPDGSTLLFESNVDPADATKTVSSQGIWSVTLSE